MSQPPFTMSKYASELDLLRDKCAWLERELAKVIQQQADADNERIDYAEQFKRSLREHWLTGVECQHEAKTDVATCYCSRWRSEPQPNIPAAVERWIEHVEEAARAATNTRRCPHGCDVTRPHSHTFEEVAALSIQSPDGAGSRQKVGTGATVSNAPPGADAGLGSRSEDAGVATSPAPSGECLCPASVDGHGHEPDCPKATSPLGVGNARPSDEWYRRKIEQAGDAMPATIGSVVERSTLDQIVDRFLAWPLPKTFSPDCGIRFDGRKDDEWNKNKTWPVGTNLFSAIEARAMLEYLLYDSGLLWRCEHGCDVERPHTHTADEVAALRAVHSQFNSETKP